MKIILRNGYLKIFLFFMSFYIYLCQNDFQNDLKAFIESPKIIKNQLCSFNSISNVNLETIKCQCHEGFVRDNNIRKINNYDVDCSYQLKSRLITFVLSLIVPLGIDYFYLEYYSIFFLIFFNVDKNFEKKYTKFKLAIIIIDFIFLLLRCFILLNI